MKDKHIYLFYPFRVFLGLIGYLSYFLAILVFLCAGLPFFLMFALWPRLMKNIMYTVLKAYTFFLTRLWLPALRIYSIAEISGFDPPALRGSVVVANHRGRLDALLMLSMLPPTGVVIKSNYARIPLYSSFVKHLDFVSIDPDSLQSLGAATEKCRQVLAKGVNLLVFPEGTRAKTGKPLAFKPFPFRIAMEANAPVVPVIIHSDLPFMARCRGSIFPKYRFRYTIRFLPAERPLLGETAPDFAQRVRAIMAGQLALLDKGTYWYADKKETA
jgi:1-acyl-sn-glycerol-3-phosphate acyltransferase